MSYCQALQQQTDTICTKPQHFENCEVHSHKQNFEQNESQKQIQPQMFYGIWEQVMFHEKWREQIMSEKDTLHGALQFIRKQFQKDKDQYDDMIRECNTQDDCIKFTLEEFENDLFFFEACIKFLVGEITMFYAMIDIIDANIALYYSQIFSKM